MRRPQTSSRSCSSRCIPDPVQSPPPKTPAAVSDVHTLFSLVSSGATWQPPKIVGKAPRDVAVRTLSGICYGMDSPQQSLDIVFPDDLVARSTTSAIVPTTELPRFSPLLPVFVFVHGGGWSRGGKDNRFYGAPSMCQNQAASGCIAVSIGYRLGAYPMFVEDAAAAVQWVRANIEGVGGDPSRVILSGHSAGAHIASLLVLRHDCFLAPLGVPSGFFRGLVLVSGVYDLFSPMRKAPLDAKNKWFLMAYVIPAFGNNTRIRREASPLLLLHPDKDTSAMGMAVTAVNAKLNSKALSRAADEQRAVNEEVKLNTSTLPATLILNASFDMGLQENGKLMAEAMGKHTDVKYMHIPWTNHASICWSPKTAAAVSEFIISCLGNHTRP